MTVVRFWRHGLIYKYHFVEYDFGASMLAISEKCPLFEPITPVSYLVCEPNLAH